jgi:hypothetical protein
MPVVAERKIQDELFIQRQEKLVKKGAHLGHSPKVVLLLTLKA